MLKNKLFCSMVVFAVAAIFATTFVSCDSSTPDPVTYYLDKVPANLATAAYLTNSFAAGNDVLIVAPLSGTDSVPLGAADLIIPPGRTLDLAGHPLAVTSSQDLVVAGTLKGLTEQTPKQITNGGAIIVKNESVQAEVDAVSSAASVVGPSTVAALSASKYFFGDFKAAASAAASTLNYVFGNVELSAVADPSGTQSDLLGLIGIYGDLKLVATAPTVASSIARTISITQTANKATFAVSTLKVTGDVTVGDNAQLEIDGAAKLTVDGTYTIGAGVVVKNGTITAGGTADTPVPVTKSYIPATTGEAPAPAAFYANKLTITGLTVTNVVIAEAAATPKYSLNVKSLSGGISGTADTLNITGTAEVGGADNAVAASGVLAVTAGSTLKVAADGVIAVSGGSITVATGGIIDLSATGGTADPKITLGYSTAGVAVGASAPVAAKIKFTDATTKVAQASTSAITTESSGTTASVVKLSGAVSNIGDTGASGTENVVDVLQAGTSSGSITLTGQSGIVIALTKATAFCY